MIIRSPNKLYFGTKSCIIQPISSLLALHQLSKLNTKKSHFDLKSKRLQEVGGGR